MGKVEVKLGPFVGGLNNSLYKDSLADNELVDCSDFDFTSDGTLITRPPIHIEGVTGDVSIDGHEIHILGFFIDTSITGLNNTYTVAEASGNLFIRLGVANGTPQPVTPWTVIQIGFGAAVCGIQYINKFYIVRQAGLGGGSWSPSTGYVAVASMPGGNSIQLFKERLWITGVYSAGTATRVYYSNVGTGATWSVADFIDVDAGNGQALSACYAGTSALYLFKSSSTYVLTYDSLPARGYIQCISPTIGIPNFDCYATYEDSIYIATGKYVYRISGYQFSQVNTRFATLNADSIPGSGDHTSYKKNPCISTVGNRLVVFIGGYNYVYYPVVNAWTSWTTTYTAKWYLVPSSVGVLGYEVYISPQNNDFNALIGGINVMQNTTTEPSVHQQNEGSGFPSIATKTYTFDSSGAIKKLYWWGINAEVASRTKSTSVVLGITDHRGVNYFKTHVIPFTSAVATPNTFYKGNQACRFRTLVLTIYLTNYDYTVSSYIKELLLSIDNKQDPPSGNTTL